MRDVLFDYAKKLNYKLFEAPRGRGLPVATEILEKQYKEGFWQFLNTIDELPNYMVVVGYVQHLAKTLQRQPRLLDIGCGHGNLAQLLSGYGWENFVGLDVSAEAVKQANELGLPRARFEVGNFEEWKTDEKFDFILSTGSICYPKNPLAAMLHLRRFLNPGGAFVVSLWRYGFNYKIWQNIEREFQVVNSTVVQNDKGMKWDVKILR